MFIPDNAYWTRLLKRLHVRAFVRLQDHTAAEEVAQEIWFELKNARPVATESEHDRLAFARLRQRAIDRLRKKGRSPTTVSIEEAAEPLDDNEVGALEAALTNETLNRLKQALAYTLSPANPYYKQHADGSLLAVYDNEVVQHSIYGDLSLYETQELLAEDKRFRKLKGVKSKWFACRRMQNIAQRTRERLRDLGDLTDDAPVV